jgi:hypothetical protein
VWQFLEIFGGATCAALGLMTMLDCVLAIWRDDFEDGEGQALMGSALFGIGLALLIVGLT